VAASIDKVGVLATGAVGAGFTTHALVQLTRKRAAEKAAKAAAQPKKEDKP
jgi:hypothetical protein